MYRFNLFFFILLCVFVSSGGLFYRLIPFFVSSSLVLEFIATWVRIFAISCQRITIDIHFFWRLFPVHETHIENQIRNQEPGFFRSLPPNNDLNFVSDVSRIVIDHIVLFIPILWASPRSSGQSGDVTGHSTVCVRGICSAVRQLIIPPPLPPTATGTAAVDSPSSP